MDGTGANFSTDEVNFLVYRYLIENGFGHTAYTFGCESNIVNSTIDGTVVPRGALISIIQKGLHFTEAEFFAALASTASDPNDSRIFESNMGSMGLLEAVLPDTDRLKILEKKVMDELGEEACARLPPNLNLSIVEPPQPISREASPTSSRTSSESETLDGMEDENDENQDNAQPTASGSSTILNANNLKDEPSYDGRPPASILAHTNIAPFANPNSEASMPANMYMNATSSSESNGMPLNAAQFSGDTANMIKMTVAVAPTVVRNSYSPSRMFTNGSNNSPNINSFAGHSGKMKAAAALAASSARPGLNGTNAHTALSDSVQLTHRNGKFLPNLPDLDPDLELDRNNVILLKGHQSDVFICTWNPVVDLVASGSGDGTARIWRSPETFGPYGTTHVETNCLLLNHRSAVQVDDSQADVTSIDWDMNGNLLATGCYDGVTRIWNQEGTLLHVNPSHHGPIFALKWNYSGTRVLSAGVDNSTIVWDPKSSKLEKFMCHTSSALDVDWITDEIFASCSVDRFIHVCQIGSTVPYKTFVGHENEVNAVKFDKVSRRLASCSDDKTLKIWSLDEEKPIYDVNAHDKEIYTIRWSPKGYSIASASFDHSIKIWDIEKSACTHKLIKHTEPVYTVAFSPDGRCIASGSIDQTVNIWDLTTGKIVLTYTHANKGVCSGVFEVDWNRRGDRIAASCGNGTLLLFDIRFLKDSLR